MVIPSGRRRRDCKRFRYRYQRRRLGAGYYARPGRYFLRWGLFKPNEGGTASNRPYLIGTFFYIMKFRMIKEKGGLYGDQETQGDQ